MLGSADISLADGSIGYIKTAEKSAFIIRKGSSLTAKVGDSVFLKDVLKTDENGAIGITFLDNTMISIGADTEYILDEYAYQPREKKLSFVSTITRGTLHFISGNISKLAPDSVSVKTPTGSIGIRGTRFLVKVREDE